MSKPVVIPNTFAAQAGPIPLSQLDADFAAAAAALNDLATYSNYFADSSGAANQITVTVALPLTFAYVTGMALQVKLANTTTATAVNINVNALGNKAVILNDGVVPPIGSLTANSILELMYDGVSFRVLTMRASTVLNTGLFADGAVGSPSISFSSDPDTGMYHVSANTGGLSGGGVRAARWDSTAFYADLTLRVQDGAVGTPSVTFDNDSDTGLYRLGANQLGIAVGGVNSASFRSALIDFQQPLYEINGSAAAPSFTFSLDTGTGFYRDTASQIAIALGGVTAGQIAQGSFTGTGTGFTAGTTATINYLRVGNIVFLWCGAGLAGTSNATTFTMTGIPAVIQPATTSVTCAFVATDNNTSALAQGSVTGGTMTFSKWTSFTATSATSWTNVLTKGLPPSWSCSYTLN